MKAICIQARRRLLQAGGVQPVAAFPGKLGSVSVLKGLDHDLAGARPEAAPVEASFTSVSGAPQSPAARKLGASSTFTRIGAVFPMTARPILEGPIGPVHSGAFLSPATRPILEGPIGPLITPHREQNRPVSTSRSVLAGEASVASDELARLLELAQAQHKRGAGVSAADGHLPVSDVRSLFSKLTTPELANALLNLELASNEAVVDVATAVLSSPRIMSWRTVSKPLLWAVENTAHAHFCAGETVEEASRTLQRMWDLGLRGILDFSVEDALDEATCERNLEGFIRTIGHTSSLPASSVSYACVKLTALCPLPVLEHASNLIRWHHLHPNAPRPEWLQDSLPVLADTSPAYNLEGAATVEPLTEEEVDTWQKTYGRLRKICQACEEQGVPLLVDAEYQSVEPAIDHLAYAAALEFNKGGKAPLVYGTVQCYLKDALPRLTRSFQEAQRQGVSFGVKLVRGAYLARETQAAQALGVPSPMFGRIDDTHQCYDDCAALMINAAARADASGPQAAVVLATHNYSSGRRAVVHAESVGLERTDPRLQFAQLKGMADGLSLTLALSGFNVSKYLPYGKVEEVMPYLLRRAQENRGVLGNTKDERRRLWKELKRRVLGKLGVA